MFLPIQIQKILHTLQKHGYEGYAVGGCVRDTLLDKSPNDWDICTNALPEQVKQCFADQRTLDTGISHGTVTLVMNHVPYEITTYRIDGDYLDHRRPSQVQFVRSLEQDLARRDFTINAMACGLDGRVQDPFGGQKDLEQKLVRCVGDPNKRFEEDALRILRALRFSAVLGFSLHPDTLAAAREKKALLNDIAMERVFVELEKMICGKYAGPVLKECGDILAQILPEITPCMGFDQKNPCHDRDVWTHIADALAAAPQEPLLRWALLLHDIAKPECFMTDRWGIGHCPQHQEISEVMAHRIFRRLKSEKKLEQQACQLILHHDVAFQPTRTCALHWLHELGEEQLLRLITMKRCDISAHAMVPRMEMRAHELELFVEQLHQVLAEGACTQISELAVNGGDLLELGIPAGPAVGRALHSLLRMVMQEKLPNQRSELLAQVRRWNT